jgi:hypothetical protein
MRKRMKERNKEEKKETNMSMRKVNSPGSLKCIRKFKASGLKDPFSFSNDVQSDNEDFLCASGSAFAISTCPLI